MDVVTLTVKNGKIHIERGNSASLALTHAEAEALLPKLLRVVLTFGAADLANARTRRIQALEQELASLRSTTT